MRWMRRDAGATRLAIIAVACLAAPSADGSDATACEQIRLPIYSLDRDSPLTDPNQPFAPGDALRAPGPMIVRPAGFFGLTHPQDDLDALSRLNPHVAPGDTFLLLFSVDRPSRGVAPPDPNLVAAGFPFNVKDQAAKGQAAADAFAGTALFDRSGPLSLPPRLRTGGNNTQIINQGDAGGIDYAVPPHISPSAVTGEPENEVDAGAGASSSPPSPLRSSRRPFDGPQAAVGTLGAAPARGAGSARGASPRILAFSVDRLSPSLANLPGTGSGADIYLAADPTDPNGPGFAQVLYAAPFQLGLLPNDDVDALLLFDNGDLTFDREQDQVIFSLARGSPTLEMLELSPADIFTTTPGGVSLYAAAVELGLGASPQPDDPSQLIRDNIDMLDFLLCDDARSCILAWAIGRPCACPADVTGDGLVDVSDLGVVLANFGATGVSPEEGDANGDSNVDITDIGIVLAGFGQGCS